MLLLILLCTFIKDENKKKHNWKTGHFFIFSMGLFQSKSNDIFLSLQENICLVFIRSAVQSLTSTHNLCFLGCMRKNSISIILFCGIFLWCGVLCLFVLRFYGPVNPMGSCRARSVYLTTHLLGRLSPLSGSPVLCTFFRQKLTTALLESAEGREWP